MEGNGALVLFRRSRRLFGQHAAFEMHDLRVQTSRHSLKVFERFACGENDLLLPRCRRSCAFDKILIAQLGGLLLTGLVEQKHPPMIQGCLIGILPILWLTAGCRGRREDSKGSQAWFIPKHSPFAVLIREKEFSAFGEKLTERDDIKWAFLVTDSEENFGLMRRALGRRYECVQLYKSYLENFRLNTPEALGEGGHEA
jgi:hypothetical protein